MYSRILHSESKAVPLKLINKHFNLKNVLVYYFSWKIFLTFKILKIFFKNSIKKLVLFQEPDPVVYFCLLTFYYNIRLKLAFKSLV